MARTVRELQIGENKYMIAMHGPDDGDEVVAYLARVAGPVAAAMMANADKDAANVGKVLSGALSNLQGRDHASFMRKLFSQCTINGRPALEVYDAHFVGLHGERYQVAAEIIRHNGFFDVIGALQDLAGAPESPPQLT